MRSGTAYRLPPLAPRIGGIASGSSAGPRYATPLASNRINRGRILRGEKRGGTFLVHELAKARRAERGRTLFPTPIATAALSKDWIRQKRPNGCTVATVLAKAEANEDRRGLFPTPTAINYSINPKNLEQGHYNNGPFLSTALAALRERERQEERALFPTPTATQGSEAAGLGDGTAKRRRGSFLRDALSVASRSERASRSGLSSRKPSRRSRPSAAGTGPSTVRELLKSRPASELLPNPELLCWLMGFPERWCWTRPASMAMRSSRTSSRPSAARSSRSARPRIGSRAAKAEKGGRSETR